MTYLEFEQIINKMMGNHKMIDNAYKLKIDLIEAFEDNDYVVDLLWKQVLTEPGYDWLSWFLYEKNYIEGEGGREDLLAWDEDKIPICYDLPSLYQYLLTNNYIKNAPHNQ
jgi:hypothetical protein